VKEHLMFKK